MLSVRWQIAHNVPAVCCRVAVYPPDLKREHKL